MPGWRKRCRSFAGNCLNRNGSNRTVNVENIKTIAVIGGGTMGNGIAHVCAMTGYNVILVETKDEFLDR
ncbi:MAG: 3-hydroxyacyl-CoA dehydrogenase NAD-binding domain-containing protein, partial [Candidatus Zixiibacteriota bacterium]